MSEIVLLVEEAPEGGYTARCLGYSIYMVTQHQISSIEVGGLML